MFHSAAIRLTFWYIVLIMGLSIGMSLVIYHVSDDSLNHNNGYQTGYFTGLLPPSDLNNFTIARGQQLGDEETHLKSNLVIFNLVVLVLGTAASYALARRTLEPIELSHSNQRRFAGDAAHELRTPLTAMKTEIEVSLRDPKFNKAQAQKLLGSTLEEINQLNQLSDGLLKLTALDANGSTYQALDLASIVKKSLATHQKAIKAKKIKVRTELKRAIVKGDETSLVQLASVLIDNAVKYSVAGGTITVELNSTPQTKLVITDEGQGISPTDLPKIFDRFYRADNARSSTAVGGYGLGLSIAKQIATNHHASIEVSSVLGKGTKFTISFPPSH